MNGRNFLVDFDGKKRKCGFFKNILIEAESPGKAEHLAIERIRENSELKKIALNIKEDPPLIFVEELKEVESFNGIECPETGCSWVTIQTPHSKNRSYFHRIPMNCGSS